jgi:hypothetical protein
MTKRQRWSKVKEVVLAGMTMKEASEAFNVKVSTVCMRAKREGWGVKELRAGRNDVLVATIEAKAAEISPGVTEHRVNMLATSMASRRALATAIQKGMAHLSKLPEAELVKQHKALASFSAAAEALFGWKALAIVEGEAAVKTVREESGQRDTRAVNLELIRTTPEQLRRMALAKKVHEARAAEGRVVEEVATKSADLGLEIEPAGSEAGSVEVSDPRDNASLDDAATQEQPAWWETARAKKLERDARILASQASRPPTAASEQVDRAPRTGLGSMQASGTEADVESPIALARKQQREESRANYERGRR